MINARRIATPAKVAAPDITKKSSSKKKKAKNTPVKSPAKSPAPAAVEEQEEKVKEVEEVEESAPALPTSLLGMINARRIATPVKVAAPDITKKSSSKKKKAKHTPVKSPAKS